MLIITNFKTYDSALGQKAIALASVHEEVMQNTNITFGVAPSALDLSAVNSQCQKVKVFAQHIDAADYGSFTGKIPPTALKKIGVYGTILNHSENRLEINYLKQCVQKAKEAGLVVVICAETVAEGVSFLKFNPDFIAVEPPELIGGDISVATANPDIIQDAVQQIGSNKVIVGAGIKNAEDVKIAKKLGASGILLASGVTKAENPKLVLEDLAKGATA